MIQHFKLLTIAVLSFCCSANSDHANVSPFINYYEVVQYTLLPSLYPNHEDDKVKRSFLQKPGFTLNFNAFKRDFSLVLRLTKEIFQTNVEVTFLSKGQEERKLLTNETFLYEGELKDEDGSHVSGYVIDDAFTGSIRTQSNETFYVEPLQERSVRDTDGSIGRRGIVYRDSDVHYQGMYDTGPLRQPAVGREPARQQAEKSTANDHGSSCPVLLAADSAFFQKIGHEDEEKTLAVMTYHLSEVDRLFRRTEFLEGTNIGLVIAAMKVFQDSESEGMFSSPDNVDVETYLRRWAKLNHGSYCLSILFTHRDFANGVLGLAWIADSDSLGGICDPWSSTYEQSFNTLLVTFINHGKTVPSKVSTLTLAHELGHAFGAQHDPPGECQPNDIDGNYVMYPQATDAAHANNDHFSQCSISDIRRIVQERALHCFTDGRSYCGNKQVEDGEQCDCGESGDECDDSCCTVKNKVLKIDGCVLSPSAQCSPKATPCCSNECRFVNESEKIVCEEETECSFTSFCAENGSCPLAQYKADKKICNNGSNVCKDGQCSGSICTLYDRVECPCLEPDHACYVCCENDQGDCLSSSNFSAHVVPQPSTTSCDVNSYCDGAGRCVKHVDKEDTSSEVSLHDVLGWISEKWYVIVFVAISLTAKLCYSGFLLLYRRCRIRPAQATTEASLDMVQIEPSPT